jgi:predicted dehydrogenase
VLVTAFHQSLYAPSFLKVKEIIRSGKIGDVLQISLKYSGFSRRWDWQTLQCCLGGSVYNSGPHPIGQGLDLIGWDENTRLVYSDLKTVLTSGDGDDYGKLILAAPGKPTVDIEINCADAFANDFVFKIFGSKGTLISSNSEYKIKYIEDFSAYPDRPVIRETLADGKGNPAYCSEKLTFTAESGSVGGSSFDVAVQTFYQMLYQSVMLGSTLDIGPEKAARVISVIEQCHAENPLPIRFN